LKRIKTVPSVGSIANNEVVKIECFDWTGGQIGNNDSADDVKNVDLTKIHYLSGPFDIEGAAPGDILLVEIQDVQPFQDQPWGFTGVFHPQNGGGFLDDLYPEPYALVLPQTQARVTGKEKVLTSRGGGSQSKGDLGFRRHLLLLPSYPARALPGPDSPRHPWLCTLRCGVERVESARGRTHRHDDVDARCCETAGANQRARRRGECGHQSESGQGGGANDSGEKRRNTNHPKRTFHSFSSHAANKK
jgi:hypothetical protein